jgi:FkbM family methyltransferase
MDETTRQELARLREEVAILSRRVADTHTLMANSYREQMHVLRRIINSATTYLGDHVAMTFLTNGCRVFVDTRDRAVGLHLLHGGQWETHYTEAFRQMLRPGATVLDVGANLGWYTLVAAPIVGRGGRVVAVEPNPRMARLLYDSIYTNGFAGWVKVVQAAVNDVPDVVDLFVHEQSPGGGAIRPANHSLGLIPVPSTRVSALPLDAIMADHPGPVDVLKMDVEGWEGVAFRGMRAVLDRSPELRMIIEWGPGQDRTRVTRAETADELAGRGYRPFRVNPDGSLARFDWEAAVKEPGLTNLVLLQPTDPLAEAVA